MVKSITNLDIGLLVLNKSTFKNLVAMLANKIMGAEQVDKDILCHY